MIRLSCSPEVRRIVKGMRNPLEMWNTLETSLDTAGSYIGREVILRQVCACRPKEDEPLKAYFTQLSNYCTQLDHTYDAITDHDFRTQIFTSLPSQYAMILHQQKTFPSGQNGSVRVDALRQSRQRHPGGGLLRARRQYHASCCISPSDRSFTVSSRSVGLLF